MFTVVIVGIIIFLNMGGITTPTVDAGTGIAKALNLIDDNQNITLENTKNSALWSNDKRISESNPISGIKYLLMGAVVAGIVLGAFGRAPDIRYITAAIVFSIASFILTDLIYIFTVVADAEGWIKYGLGAIVGGLIAGFVITTLQFWQGTD